jgi:TPR repeat protein
MLVALTGAAVAGPWEDAFRGDAAAQLKVGDMYASGDGVPHDYGEAVKWYRLAADQGYAGAQSALGNMYANGRTSLLAGFGFAWFTTMVDKEHRRHRLNNFRASARLDHRGASDYRSLRRGQTLWILATRGGILCFSPPSPC